MMSRRTFVRTAALAAFAPARVAAAQEPAAATEPLALAEWSYRWIGVERVELFRGHVISGRQMYVETLTPARVRHPNPVVLVHEPGRQASDWLTTASGEPGWAIHLLREGYAVVLVDLPGHGRVPYHPDLHGPFGQAPTYERTAFTGDEAAVDQFMAASGPSPAGAARALEVWRSRAALLLDEIGPAVIVTHGASAPFAWGAAAVRPLLVRGMAAVDPGDAAIDSDIGKAFAPATFIIRSRGGYPMLASDSREQVQPLLDWLGTRTAVALFDATGRRTPVAGTNVDLAEIGGFWVGVRRRSTPYGTVAQGQAYVQYLIPARQQHRYPIVLVHGGGGQGTHWMGAGDGGPGWAHYYLQQGYAVYLLDCPGYGRSPEHPDGTGTTGPLRVIEGAVEEVKRAVNNPTPQWDGTGEVGDPAMDLFLAGEVGFIQRDLPIVHGWWASAAEELLDRIGPAVIQMHTNGGAFGWIAADRRPGLVKALAWTILAQPDTPFADRLPWGMTSVPVAYDPPAASPTDLAIRRIPASDGVPAHRLQADPPRRLKNLAGIPILLVSGEFDGRAQAPAVAAYFRQAGCRVDHLRLQDRGLRGNGALVMWEKNEREVFEVIRGWIDMNVDSA